MKGQKGKLAAFVARSAPAPATPLEERLRRADEALAEVQTSGGKPTVGSMPTVGLPPTIGTLPTVGKPGVEPLEKPTVGPGPTVGRVPAVRIAVKPKKGHLRIPNHIIFHLLPQLPIAERAVYLELYGWTHGFGEQERQLSIAKLCKSLRIDYKRFIRIVTELKAKGLVEMDARVIDGPRDHRGTVFRVYEPLVLGPDGTAPTVGGEPTVGQAPIMKKKKERKEEKAPAVPAVDIRAQTIGTLRAIARSYRHSTPDVDDEHVRARLRHWFETEGRVVDEAMIDEALGAVGL